MSELASVPHELFGGAIIINLPSGFIDASDLRQVPDTQEVFLSCDSDLSFIIEILQRVNPDDGQGAVKFHFDSLAHDNSATSQEILSITLPTETQSTSSLTTPYPIILVGKQKVRKFNRLTPDDICIYMALYRIESKSIDLVLTMNVPKTVVGNQQSSDESLRNVRHTFDTTAHSLNIVDFGLFV